MGVYAIKPRFQRALRGVEHVLLAWRVPADAITLGALGLAGLGGAALLASSAARWTLALIPLLAVGRLVLNALDGMVARDGGTARPFGLVLNELGDRLADLAFLAPLAFLPGVSAALVGAALTAVFLASLVGLAAQAAGGQRLYDGVLGKADRMLLWALTAVLAALLPDPVLVHHGFLALLLIGGLITLGQRLRAASKTPSPPGRGPG